MVFCLFILSRHFIFVICKFFKVLNIGINEENVNFNPLLKKISEKWFVNEEKSD